MRGNCAERYCSGNGKLIRRGEMDRDKCHIHKKSCDKRLENADDSRLLPDACYLRKAEFVADGKGDESERDITYYLV